MWWSLTGNFERSWARTAGSSRRKIIQILLPIIINRIKLDSAIFSDTATWYNGLGTIGYLHKTVDHGKEEYVSGDVYINGMEGFWGLSKTNMQTYKGIKKKNWALYLKEMEFRYNYRDLTFEQMVEKIIGLLLNYNKKLDISYKE